MPPVKPICALSAILATAFLITAPAADAQTKEQKAGARAAAEAGGDAFDAGKYAEAADLFERAERLLHAPPHLLWAARAHVKLGHLVEARELYLTLTRERLAPNAPRPFREAQQQGEKELAAVEPRLAYASVVVQGGAGASGLRVTRNGEPVPPELLGVPTPVNPGDYKYQAFAEGMESTIATISFSEGSRETVVLTMHELPGSKKAVAAPPPSRKDSTAPTPGPLTDAPPADAHSNGGRPLLIGSLIGFGVAAAGGAVGTVFLLKGISRQDEADSKYREVCPVPASCPQQAVDTYVAPIDNDATSKKNVALVSYIAGGAGLATGITLLILDQNRNSSRLGRQTLMPLVGLGYAGLAGSF